MFIFVYIYTKTNKTKYYTQLLLYILICSTDYINTDHSYIFKENMYHKMVLFFILTKNLYIFFPTSVQRLKDATLVDSNIYSPSKFA